MTWRDQAKKALAGGVGGVIGAVTVGVLFTSFRANNFTEWADRHEGSGSWLAGLGTFAAVATSLAIAWSASRREERERRQQDRERLSIVTSRRAMHECLQLAMIYQPRERYSGITAKVRVIGPHNAFLMEAVRRSMSQGDRHWVDINIGRVAREKEMNVSFGWRFGDPDDALRGAIFVANGPGDELRIDQAEIEISIFQVGVAKPLTSLRCWVNPIGEDPKRVQLERQNI
jgi:hypothetical protein